MMTLYVNSLKRKMNLFMLDFRLRAYAQLAKMVAPEWACVQHTNIDYQDILYYSAPKSKKKLDSLR